MPKSTDRKEVEINGHIVTLSGVKEYLRVVCHGAVVIISKKGVVTTLISKPKEGE